MPPAVKIGIAVALVGAAVYGLSQCSGRADERPPLVPVAEPVEDGTGPRFYNRWWERAGACPDGALLRGAAPPSGRDVWCELPDGTRHGPHTAWWPNGRTHFQRNYSHGRVDGPWQKWRPSGERWATGAYRDGVRTGRWIEWGDLGEATVTDYE